MKYLWGQLEIEFKNGEKTVGDIRREENFRVKLSPSVARVEFEGQIYGRPTLVKLKCIFWTAHGHSHVYLNIHKYKW